MSAPQQTRVIGEDWLYHAAKGAERNSLLHNPEMLHQNLAQEAALVRALHAFVRSRKRRGIGPGVRGRNDVAGVCAT
jgi:hypothetical protein